MVEMLVYIAILAALFLTVVDMMLTIGTSYSTLKATKLLNTSASSAMERISREAKNALSIDDANSIFGAALGELSLVRPLSDGATTTVKLFLENEVLELSEDGVLEGPLTGEATKVKKFWLTKMILDQSVGIKIELTLESQYKGKIASSTFYTTEILRGSYQN